MSTTKNYRRGTPVLRERHEPDKLFDKIVALLPEMDAALAKIGGYLDDDEMIKLVKANLAKQHQLTVVTGRPSTAVKVVIRLMSEYEQFWPTSVCMSLFERSLARESRCAECSSTSLYSSR